MRNKIVFSLVLLSVALLTWQCKEDTFEGEIIGICPEVVTTNPANGAINVNAATSITATFNEEMEPMSINAGTFSVKKGIESVAGDVSYSGLTATFTPAVLLDANSVYSATISRKVEDLMGNIMVRDTTWNFNTGSVPTLTLTSPVEGASNIALNTMVTADFSTAMDANSFNTTTFSLKQGTVNIPGGVSYSGLQATFDPTVDLIPNLVYTATITKSVTDIAGNAIAKDSSWSFATGVLPVITSTNPLNGAVDVLLNANVLVSFSKIMNPITFTTTTFTLKQGAAVVAGERSYDGMTMTFNPDANLLPGVEYTATVTTGVKDVLNNSLQKDSTWTFTTIVPLAQFSVSLSALPAEGGSTLGAGTFEELSSVTIEAEANPGYSFVNWTESGVEVANTAEYTFGINFDRVLVANFDTIIAGPGGVNLGSAGDFAILSGSGIMNTGTGTRITGDVGSHPTATIVGLLESNVNGTLYVVADPVVAAAKVALEAAYIDAQGRSTDAISLPGQVGGLTLAPGLYVNSTTSGISGTGSNAILTLDAGGNPNAVWIFKVGSTFVTDTGTSIVLAGGAQAKNIYWSVGTSATLGTYSIFYGNILADQSITLATGATFTGRALTRIGSVTLDNNIVKLP